MMSLHTILFYLMAALILGGGIMAVISRKIFRAAVYLLFSLIGIAGLYFWMEYEFLAAVQIIVYVGGIVVLIIFSIFLTQTSSLDMPKPNLNRRLFAGLAMLSGLLLTITLILQHSFISSLDPVQEVNVSSIGLKLLSVHEGGYALPFEVVSVLLLAAMIGCIAIAIKSPAQK